MVITITYSLSIQRYLENTIKYHRQVRILYCATLRGLLFIYSEILKHVFNCYITFILYYLLCDIFSLFNETVLFLR